MADDNKVMLNSVDFMHMVQRQAVDLARALDPPSPDLAVEMVIGHIERMHSFAVKAKELVDVAKAKAA